MSEFEELRRSLSACVCECVVLKAQRDELLAALEYVINCEARDDFSDLQPVRAAIAKVKEQS